MKGLLGGSGAAAAGALAAGFPFFTGNTSWQSLHRTRFPSSSAGTFSCLAHFGHETSSVAAIFALAWNEDGRNGLYSSLQTTGKSLHCCRARLRLAAHP